MSIIQDRVPSRRPWTSAFGAGVVQGLCLSMVGVALGWVLTRDDVASSRDLLVAGSLTLVAVIGAWCSGYGVLLARGVPRPGLIAWCTLGGTALAGGLAAVVIGSIAFAVGLLSALVTFSGEFIVPIVVVSVVLSAACTIMVGVGVSIIAVRALARDEVI
ncbi:hypothetical protein ACEXQD_02780 [Herbiconiux sp. P15]|uniref:hypothetical protein n=1 Tax=Herbiconiux liukaitaii TaxID=3342799 RepID=UPI0035BAB4C5